MRKIAVILVLSLSLLYFLPLHFVPIAVKAPDSYPVHNIDTGFNYTAIQEAIDANETLNGHTIFVEAGIYLECVDVHKNLTLVGESRDTTIIDGSGTITPGGTIVVELSATSNITGFTIRNGDYGIQVYSYSPFPTYTGHMIDGNKIVNNSYGGIHLRGVGWNSITDNIIANNTLFGIHLCHAGNNTISNNLVLNNGHGIDFDGNSNNNTLRDNNMTLNTYNFGLILRGEARDYLGTQFGIVNDVDTSNTVNGKPIYYWINRHDEEIPSNAGYVWLAGCSNITIQNMHLSNNLQGILLLWTNGTVVKGNNIADNVYGIYIEAFSNNNTMINNSLSNNLNGIYLGGISKFTTMKDNNITGGQMNFGLYPDVGRVGSLIGFPKELINDIDISNTVDGKPIIYWINKHDQQVPTNSGYVMLINCTGILIRDLNLSNNVQNILIRATNNTMIANNSIANSVYGIDAGSIGYLLGDHITLDSFNTTINENSFNDNGVAIRLRSSNSTISNNLLNRNPLGIKLEGSDYTAIRCNTVMKSDDLWPPSPGFMLTRFYYPEWTWERSRELMMLQLGGIISGGKSNFIYGNTVKDSLIGISTVETVGRCHGDNNTIFNNNIINSSYYQAMNWFKGRNQWDNGHPNGGNYWSDHTAIDMNRDGVCDSPYNIFENGVDNYPLMGMFHLFNTSLGKYVDAISNSTIEDFESFESNSTIKMYVSNMTGDQTHGFCRIGIPYEVMSEPFNVTIDGACPTYWNYTLYDNGTHRWIYFSYQHSTLEVIIIPELPSLFILPIFILATLLAALLYKRKQEI